MNRMRKWKYIFWVVRAAVLVIYKHYLMYPIFGNLSDFGDSSNLKKLSVALWHFMNFLGKDYTLKINRLVDVSLYPFYICACVRSLIVRLNLSPLFFNKVIPESIFCIYLINFLFILVYYSHNMMIQPLQKTGWAKAKCETLSSYFGQTYVIRFNFIFNYQPVFKKLMHNAYQPLRL